MALDSRAWRTQGPLDCLDLWDHRHDENTLYLAEGAAVTPPPEDAMT